MAAEADELRREIRDLFEKRDRGDVPARTFERRLTEKSVALGRAVASERLAPGETILAAHHVVHSHLKLTNPVLREPEQITASFFATERRLIRVRGTMAPGRPVSCDEADGTVVDDLPYTGLARVVPRWQVRWGEAAVGLVVAATAFLLRDVLAVTGPILAILGGAGILHGLLMPTRWLELVAHEVRPEPPFEIYAPLRRSARRLLAIVRNGLARSREGSEHDAGSGEV
jgi:hypothetical protein